MPRNQRLGVAPRARKAQPGRSRFPVEPSVTSNPAVLARFSAAWLRRRVRASEAMLILLAVGIGAASALLSVVQGGIARTLQHVLFALPPSSRLSEAPGLSTLSLLVLPAGGVVLALISLAVRVR